MHGLNLAYETYHTRILFFERYVRTANVFCFSVRLLTVKMLVCIVVTTIYDDDDGNYVAIISVSHSSRQSRYIIGHLYTFARVHTLTFSITANAINLYCQPVCIIWNLEHGDT